MDIGNNNGLSYNRKPTDKKLSNKVDKLEQRLEEIEQGNLDLEEYAKKEDIPSKTSELENDSNFADEEYVDDAIDVLEKIQYSDTPPTDESVSIWINTSEDASIISMPRINDSVISSSTIWTSERIDKQITDKIIQAKLEGEEIDLSEYATKDELHQHNNKVVLDTITEEKVSNWDNKSEFDGNYNSLTNKPNIPSIEGLASEDYVNDYVENAIKDIPEIDLSEYATKDELDIKANNLFKANMNTINSLGGIPANTDLNNLSIQEVLTKLLYPYVQPTVSASIIYSPSGNIYEFGQTVNVAAMNIDVTKKSENITQIDCYVNEILNKSLTTDIANGGKFLLTFTPAFEIKKSITNSYFQARVTDASGKIVNINTVALNFYYPYYYGVIDENAIITQDLVKGLTKQVVEKGNKTYTFNPNNQKILIAYPKSYGVLKSILDPNGFEQLATFTQTELVIVGLDNTSQSYYIYVNGASTNTNFTMRFNY